MLDGKSLIPTIHDQWFVKRIVDGRIKVYIFMDVALLFIPKDDSEITTAEFGGFSPRSKLTTLDGGYLYYFEKNNGIWQVIGRTPYQL